MPMNRRAGLAAWPLAAAILATICGCADLVAPTTRTAVDSGLGTLEEPQDRRAIENILRSDEITSATRSLTRAVLDEIIGGGGRDADARLSRLAADFARDIGPALGMTLDDVVLPRVQAAIAADLEAALSRLLDEHMRQRVGEFAAEVAAQAASKAGPSIANAVGNGVTVGITAAVQRILRQDLGPAISPAISQAIGQALQDNTPALARSTRALADAALEGVADAMNGPFGDMFRKERDATIAAVRAAEAQQQRALVDEIGRQIAESRRWFETLMVMLAVAGVLLLGMAALLWHLLTEQRKLRTPSQP